MSSPRKKPSLPQLGEGRRKENGRISPEGNCPICLGKIEDKSFANRCFHSFCKTCLIEWTKVKAECPVCRQNFDRILYDVKTMDDYKEHKIEPPVPESMGMMWSNLDGVSRLMPFSYAASLPPLRRRVLEFQRLLQVQAQGTQFPTMLPHSVHLPRAYPFRDRVQHHRGPYREVWRDIVISSPNNERRTSVSTTSVSTHTRVEEVVNLSNDSEEQQGEPYQLAPPVGTSAHRSYIYANDLYVLPYGNGDRTRYRRISASFYRKNPACTHRLVPWLNREFLAILDYPNETEVLLGRVMKCIISYEITSQHFRRVVEPYMRGRIDHFIHEFFNYASSCHDMEAYTLIASYVPKNQTDVVKTLGTPTPMGYNIEPESSNSSNESVKNHSDIVIDVEDSDDANEEPKEDLHVENTSEVVTEEVQTINVDQNDSNSSNTLNDTDLNVNIIDDFDNPKPGPSGINTKCKRVTISKSDTDETKVNVVDFTDDDDEDVAEQQPLIDQFTGGSHKRSAEQSGEDSDDSVLIIGYKKPLHERTPEMIALSTESEIDIINDSEPPKKLDLKHLEKKVQSRTVHNLTSPNSSISSPTRRKRKRRKKREYSSSLSSSDSEFETDRCHHKRHSRKYNYDALHKKHRKIPSVIVNPSLSVIETQCIEEGMKTIEDSLDLSTLFYSPPLNIESIVNPGCSSSSGIGYSPSFASNNSSEEIQPLVMQEPKI